MRLRAPQCRLCDPRAIAASVPFKWLAGDTVYGVGDIEQQLGRAGNVLGVSSAQYFSPGASGDRLPAQPRRSPGRDPRLSGTDAAMARAIILVASFGLVAKPTSGGS
jgi:SRSO17 transposase